MQFVKSGYLLQVTTWENDGDFYNMKQFCGLSQDEASFLIDVCSLFRRGVELHDIDYSELVEEIDTIKNKYIDLSIPVSFIVTDEDQGYIEDLYSEAVHELIGYSENDEYWRVVDKVELFNIPPNSVEVIDIGML